MVVQHFIAVLLVSVCAATRIQFPEKNACILIDFETNNSLSWTPGNGTEMAIANWDISNFSVPEGNCSGTPYLVIKFHVDNATLRFDFNNDSGKVDLKMTLNFRPDVVFKNNTDKKQVKISVPLMAGSTEKAFKCNSEQKAPGKKMVGKDEYKITYRITNLKTQGYGVENGTYSKDTEECPEDTPTTVPPNTTVTTAPPNTTVTTAPPNTTVTTHPPTTTTQPPNAPKVTLYATDGNKTCAMMQGAFTFMIPYNTSKKGTESAKVEIPQNVKSEGNCMNQNMIDILKATFGGGWEMDFVFRGDGTYIWLDQLNMTVVYNETLFPDIVKDKNGTNATFSAKFDNAFKAKKEGSYLCDSETTTTITSGITMKTKDFQYTALQDNVTKFSDKNVAECSADAKTSSIVPIAVGAALAGLVVIVLIAYLIGRRRNRKGYESV
ncbi:lysosome-associated membrane glycoprotein 1-like [Mercenaria mercenaria]|uniref:lysosome-associated membrane glycoprotein 1-like n=1 Tax=Mercenaria mercenaria TaxID=6596 RepID=UPI00234E45BF|nr:lysosome-associated membrane glycoprotein 1-like [Mercenaria mercenaria]